MKVLQTDCANGNGFKNHHKSMRKLCSENSPKIITNHVVGTGQGAAAFAATVFTRDGENQLVRSIVHVEGHFVSNSNFFQHEALALMYALRWLEVLTLEKGTVGTHTGWTWCFQSARIHGWLDAFNDDVSSALFDYECLYLNVESVWFRGSAIKQIKQLCFKELWQDGGTKFRNGFHGGPQMIKHINKCMSKMKTNKDNWWNQLTLVPARLDCWPGLGRGASQPVLDLATSSWCPLIWSLSPPWRGSTDKSADFWGRLHQISITYVLYILKNLYCILFVIWAPFFVC